jgi:hypothetical protein
MRTAIIFIAMFLSLQMLGCDDPCRQLARRICRCEQKMIDRSNCESFRVNNRNRSSVEATEAQENFCIEKLDTCNCAALDRHETEACGFTRE